MIKTKSEIAIIFGASYSMGSLPVTKVIAYHLHLDISNTPNAYWIQNSINGEYWNTVEIAGGGVTFIYNAK